MSSRTERSHITSGSDHYFESIINGYSGFIYTVTKDYTIEFMNQTMIDHIGYDATGKNCHQVIHGLDQKCSWCLGEKVLAGEPQHFEYKSPRDQRWYYYVSTPRRNSENQIVAQQLIAIDIHDRKLKEEALIENEICLKQENTILKSAAISRYGLGNIVGQSYKMQELYNLILEVASSDASVLIIGESGTGKELAAQAIHNLGPKKNKPFLPVNCGGIPDTLIESEFFGYQKGAFSGAHINKSGFLKIADQGTLFLDEIGEINQSMQVKLLRAIDGDGYTPLGSHEVVKPQIRIIAATHKNLDELVEKKVMRSDFYYRINVVPIYLPPLRERRDDIALLIYHFIKKFSDKSPLPHVPPRIMTALEQYDWPGNVRELQNIIHRYVTLNRLDVFDEFLTTPRPMTPDDGLDSNDTPLGASLKEMMDRYEQKILATTLAQHRYNQRQTADTLGINRKTLYSKIKKFNL